MIDQSRIILLVFPKLFLNAFPQPTRDRKFTVIPLNECQFLAMRDIQTVLTRKRRFGKTQQIDRIQHIGFTLTVQTYKAVELGSKLQTRFMDIPVVQYVERFKHTVPRPLW